MLRQDDSERKRDNFFVTKKEICEAFGITDRCGFLCPTSLVAICTV